MSHQRALTWSPVVHTESLGNQGIGIHTHRVLQESDGTQVRSVVQIGPALITTAGNELVVRHYDNTQGMKCDSFLFKVPQPQAVLEANWARRHSYDFGSPIQAVVHLFNTSIAVLMEDRTIL